MLELADHNLDIVRRSNDPNSSNRFMTWIFNLLKAKTITEVDALEYAKKVNEIIQKK